MARSNKVSLVVVVLACAATIALVCAAVFVRGRVKTLQAAQTWAPSTQSTRVRVARIERRLIGVRAEFHGFLQPLQEISVSADVAGQIIQQRVEVSEDVARGQLLFKIDDRVRKIEHEQALAAYDRACSEFELALAQWDRIRGLGEDQVSTIERKDAESNYLSAKAIKQRADATVRLAALLLERTSVESPIDGVVSRIHARRGEFARPTMPLVDVIEIDRLKLLAEIEDRDAVWVNAGQPVILSAAVYPGERFHGTVLRVFPQALPTSRRFEMEIELSNPDRRLRPGFFMNGTIAKPPSNNPADAILVVPREAVTAQYGGRFCFVVRPAEPQENADETVLRATRVAVTVLPIPSDPRLLHVVEGLEEGDLVVTKGLQHLADQTRVSIED